MKDIIKKSFLNYDPYLYKESNLSGHLITKIEKKRRVFCLIKK
jgi:hypothetical protein